MASQEQGLEQQVQALEQQVQGPEQQVQGPEREPHVAPKQVSRPGQQGLHYIPSSRPP